MVKRKWKIDISKDGGIFPYALYYWKEGKKSWFFREEGSWKIVEQFMTIADAKAFYEKVKNMPFYLD